MQVTAITAEFVAHLNENCAGEYYSFDAEAGRKFDKITQRFGGSNGQKSVHAFVERATGNLIKAATYKAPQKDKNGLAVRYCLADAAGMAEAKDRADAYGSYLYKR